MPLVYADGGFDFLALPPKEVVSFLEEYGYPVEDATSWRPETSDLEAAAVSTELGQRPQLGIQITGHVEVQGQIWYALSCSLTLPSSSSSAAIAPPPPPPAQPPATPATDEPLGSTATSTSELSSPGNLDVEARAIQCSRNPPAPIAAAGAPTTVEAAPVMLQWRAKRKLSHLLECLHDPVKRELGASYAQHFGSTPFMRFRGLFGGTTERLGNWLGALSLCLNEGHLSPRLSATLLQFLEPPAPGSATPPKEATPFSDFARVAEAHDKGASQTAAADAQAAIAIRTSEDTKKAMGHMSAWWWWLLPVGDSVRGQHA